MLGYAGTVSTACQQMHERLGLKRLASFKIWCKIEPYLPSVKMKIYTARGRIYSFCNLFP
jgi:hypothetical protein